MNKDVVLPKVNDTQMQTSCTASLRRGWRGCEVFEIVGHVLSSEKKSVWSEVDDTRKLTFPICRTRLEESAELARGHRQSGGGDAAVPRC